MAGFLPGQARTSVRRGAGRPGTRDDGRSDRGNGRGGQERTAAAAFWAQTITVLHEPLINDGSAGKSTQYDWSADSRMREPRPSFRPGLLTCYFSGVSDGIRTHDIQDHNLAL